MKRLKLLTGILAATMIMGSTLTVSAATVEGTAATGTITVENAVKGQTYSVYKILDFELSNAATDSSSATGVYKLTGNAWDSFIKNSGCFDIDSNNYVTPKETFTDTVAAGFAKAALEYASQNNISADLSGVADDAGMTFTKLGYGYFLMDSSTGALCSLDTSTGSVTITEKNGVPTVEKEVLEGENYGATNDAEIGDTIYYQTTITAQKGAQNYVLHDEMEEGLTFDGDSVVVTVGDSTLTNGKEYTLVEEPTDGCTFEVYFAKDYLDTISDETKIVVSYSATLNENAEIDSANSNDTYLTYGDKNKTENDETQTYTYDFDLIKYTGSLEDHTYLAGASFKLYRNSDDTDVVKLVATDTANTYRVATANDTNTIEEFTTDETGKIVIEGLDEATYYLVETAAPTGYTQLTEHVVVKITKGSSDGSANGTITLYQDGLPTTQIAVLNNSGSLLPSTGGIGTTIFYLVGGVLILAAIAAFIVKRKVAA